MIYDSEDNPRFDDQRNARTSIRDMDDRLNRGGKDFVDPGRCFMAILLRATPRPAEPAPGQPPSTDTTVKFGYVAEVEEIYYTHPEVEGAQKVTVRTGRTYLATGVTRFNGSAGISEVFVFRDDDGRYYYLFY